MFEIFNVSVNPFVIGIAAFVYFLFCLLVFSNNGFGNFLRNLFKSNKTEFSVNQKNLILLFITSLIIAGGLNSILQYSAMLSGLNSWQNIFATAFMTATTISTPAIFVTTLLENKDKKSILLVYFYNLIGFILICAILSLLQTI